MQTEHTVTYHAVVTGRAWGGFNAEMEYNFAEHPTEAMLKAKTGDFESLKTVKVTRVETVTCQSATRVKLK